MQKPSAQKQNSFNQHLRFENTKKYSGINALIQPVAQHTYIGNKRTELLAMGFDTFKTQLNEATIIYSKHMKEGLTG